MTEQESIEQEIIKEEAKAALLGDEFTRIYKQEIEPLQKEARHLELCHEQNEVGNLKEIKEKIRTLTYQADEIHYKKKDIDEEIRLLKNRVSFLKALRSAPFHNFTCLKYKAKYEAIARAAGLWNKVFIFRVIEEDIWTENVTLNAGEYYLEYFPTGVLQKFDTLFGFTGSINLFLDAVPIITLKNERRIG